MSLQPKEKEDQGRCESFNPNKLDCEGGFRKEVTDRADLDTVPFDKAKQIEEQRFSDLEVIRSGSEMHLEPYETN